MKTELLDADDPAWAALLSDAQHDFYHLPGYASVCAAQEEGEAKAILVTDGGRSMLLPLVLRPITRGGRDATSPYGYPGPVVRGSADASFVADALASGLSFLASEGVVSLFVRLHPILNCALPEVAGEIVHHGDTVDIDLTLPEEELWKQTRPNHRTQINRAMRAGRVAAFDDKWTRFDAFKRLYSMTMSHVSASSYYFFDEGYFDDLRDALGDRIHLCVVGADQSIAVAGLFVETDGIVQYHLSGSDPAFAREGLTKLMFHHVRSWAKARGNRHFHLGGGVGGADDPLLHFKAGFSPLRRPFHTLRAILDEREYARHVQAHAAEIGSSLSAGFFPAYRAPRSGARDA